MRCTGILVVLLFLSGAALRAQEAGRAQEPEGHAGHEGAAHPSGLRTGLEADWSKVQEHWSAVQSAAPGERAKHLEMHRAMIAELMNKLAAHVRPAEEASGEISHEGHAETKPGLQRVQTHWRAVQGIKDPQQLEIHLAMHMDMLKELMEGPHGGIEKEGMRHGEMEHGRAGHGEADHEGKGQGEQTEADQMEPYTDEGDVGVDD